MTFYDKKYRKILYVLIAIISVSLIISLLFIQNRYLYELSLQIEDTNGNSKQLCFITDEMIGEITEEYRAIKKTVIVKGTNSSGIEGYFADCDCKTVDTKIGMLSGIYVCNAYMGNGQKVEYTVESNVKCGNMRIVITDEDNMVLYDVPIDSKQTISFVTEKSKAYYVKLIGESAEIEVKLERK